MDSKSALAENGEPLLSKNGKKILRKSYSVLQDDFFRYMRSTGYTDVERGERGSSEEHLTVTQFKVAREQERLADLTEHNAQMQNEAARLAKDKRMPRKRQNRRRPSWMMLRQAEKHGETGS
jgi:ribosomal protein L39E